MKTRIRILLALTTVGLVGGIGLIAAVLNPTVSRLWLVACGVMAAALSVEAVSSKPRDLLPAILFALLPVAKLPSAGVPSWLGLAFASLLLVAGELGALVWDGPAGMLEDGSLATRIREAVLMAMLGMGVAVLLDLVARTGLLRGTWAVAAGSAGIAGVGFIAFPHLRRNSQVGGLPAPEGERPDGHKP